MNTAAPARPLPTLPLIAVTLLLAGLAVVLESQLKLPIRLPGHRAFPGALALVLLSGRAPRAMLLGFAAVVGVVIALVSQSSGLAIVWLVPATLLALARPPSLTGRFAVAVGAGLAFGLLRYLALPGALHHTPEAVRLTGHLVFGALGALGVRR